MPRRKNLTPEQRNALERFAIDEGRMIYQRDRNGNIAHAGFVEGFMRGVQLPAEERANAITRTVQPSNGRPAAPRKRRKVVDLIEDGALPISS